MKLKIKILYLRFKQSKFLLAVVVFTIGYTTCFIQLKAPKTYEYIQGGLPYTKSIIINAEASDSDRTQGEAVSTATHQVIETPTDNISVDSLKIGIQSVDELADYIWLHESTRGKNNYSKCEAIGKVNGIGYGIWGGKWMCFENHEEEMETVKKWITNKRAVGLSDTELLCLYSGSNYSICK